MKVSAIELSNRIRFESLAKFSSELSKAQSLQEVNFLLKKNFKYLVDSTFYTYLILADKEKLFYFSSDDSFRPNFDKAYFYNQNPIPEIVYRETVNESPLKQYFEHFKFSSLLKYYQENQHLKCVILLNNGNEDNSHLDIKFANQVLEHIAPKIYSLFLTDKISQKNAELEKAYHEISSMHNALNSSIVYAKQIQGALIHSKKHIRSSFWPTLYPI